MLLRPSLPPSLPALAVVGLLAACSGDDDSTGTPTMEPAPTSDTTDTGPPGDDDDDVSGGELGLASAVSPHVPSVVHLTGTAPEGAARVQAVATAADGHSLELELDVGSGPLLVPVVGMLSGVSYEVVVEVFDGADASLATESLTVLAPEAPPEFQGIQGVKVDQPIDVPYVALAFIGDDDSYAVIVDDQARVVWWMPSEPGQIILTPVLSRDGTALLWGEYSADRSGDTGTWYRVPFDGTELVSRRLQLSHHAAVEMPDGGVAWLGLDWRTVTNTDGEMHHMAADRIYEGPMAYEADPTELYNTFDDHPDAPSFTCEHMVEPFERFGESGIEWTHGNSLVYLDSQDAFYLNAKTTDWLLKIDRSTGTLLWQLGGFGSDFTYPDGSPTFTSAYAPTLVSHGHMSEVWEGGMVMFDNGDHRSPVVSSVAEFAWDESDMTVERVWEYFHPGGRNTYALGDAKKLSDGSYLVGWGALSELMVVSPDHQVTWHVTIPPRYTVGRVLALEHL